MRRVETIWEPCLFWARPYDPLKRVENGDIGFLTEIDWGIECCHGNGTMGHFVSFVMYISGARFEEHHPY